MEIKLNKLVEEVRSIELPYYAKNICYAWKVISEKEVLQVYCSQYSGGGITIEPYVPGAVFNTESEQITEDEFIQIYLETQSKLNKLL